MRAVDEERLRVREAALAGRRIPHVPDGDRTAQRGQVVAVENVGHVPHRARQPDDLMVRRGDAGALLPAMLERVESEVRHVGGFGVTEDPEDAAFVLEFIEAHATCRAK